MSLPLTSQGDLYNLFIVVLQDEAPELTDTFDGSTIDALAGVFSVAAMELQRLTQQKFNATFLSLAQGPATSPGGTDDLQTLATDHYGPNFGRPGAIQAVDTATFSRGTNAAGAITIPAGSIVKTQPDANGNVQRYATQATVTLTNNSSGSDLTISVAIKAVVAGAAGSAVSGAINVIETSLLDTSIVVTNAGNATGEDAEDDANYLQTIYNLIEGLRGATKSAIIATAKTVAGVVTATVVETELNVIQWDPILLQVVPGATYFRTPRAILYIADSTGTASPTLVAEVSTAIDGVRAYGVHIDVQAATALSVNWSAHLVLNPSGPNYSTLISDTTLIVNAMSDYINALAVATNFVVATANAAILATFGPAGSNDITSFTTTIPTGDIAVGANQKTIPGTVATV